VVESRCNVADVIRAACELQHYPRLPGMRLALEDDGTIIGDDDVLIRWASRSLMLLLPGQQWTSDEEMSLYRSQAQLSYNLEGFGGESVFSSGASFNTFRQTPRTMVRTLGTSYGDRQYVLPEFVMEIIYENLQKSRKPLKQKKRTDWQRKTGAFIVLVANCCIWYGVIASIRKLE